MDEPNSNAEQPGLMARLGNWLKKEPSGGVVEPSEVTVRHRGPSARADIGEVERQARKAKLGLVRKSEFEDLRRSIGHTPIPKGSTFSLTSALVPNTSFLARARQNTRLKIDSIEEQISRSWFNSGLQRGSAITGMATLRGSSSRPFKSTNQTDMRVEINGAIVTLALPPEARNAATAYALGDFVTAEQVLITLTKKSEPLETAQISWDLLFEFYLALGRQTDFDNLSVDFAGRFGISPPLWAEHWNVESKTLVPEQADAASAGSDLVATTSAPQAVEVFTVASYLIASDVEALAAHFDQSGARGLWQVDWKKLAEIDIDALPHLMALTERVLNSAAEVRYLGEAQLIGILRQQTKVPDLARDVQKQLWCLLAMHLQLVGDPSQLEELSFHYTVLFEESLPTIPSVSCRYVSEPSTGLADAPEPEVEQRGEEQVAETSSPPVENGFRVVDADGGLVTVAGALKGDISQELATLPLPSESQPLVFDCKGFTRLDSQAAGHLLSFLRSKKCGPGTVKLRDLNRLIGIYLFSFGLPPNVTIAFVKL